MMVEIVRYSIDCVGLCVALKRKAPFSCKAPPFASGEAPGLFGYSHSNAYGHEVRFLVKSSLKCNIVDG